MPRPTEADSRTSDAKCVAPSRRILPSCSQPSRTLRAADAVAPKTGPSLTAAARDGPRNERPGRKNGSAGPNKRIGGKRCEGKRCGKRCEGKRCGKRCEE